MRLAQDAGQNSIILDFSHVSHLLPEGIVPIICAVEHARDALGLDFKVEPPNSDELSRLFVNTNWAHLLDPESYGEATTLHHQTTRTSRYVTYDEQKTLVDSALVAAMQNLELNRRALAALELTLQEITENVLNHADSGSRGGLGQVAIFPERKRISFVVADSGRGILSSLSEGHPDIENDKVAIEEAIKAGVTRNPKIGQGNGLADTLHIVQQLKGWARIRSGRAQLLVFPEGDDYRKQSYMLPSKSEFHGTSVAVELSSTTTIPLAQALGLGLDLEWDFIDANYLDASLDALVVPIASESTGFGSRHAGAQLRLKLSNLLAAEPSKRLVIDWAGVPLISSSFADEAVGRLFVDMGPTHFMTRVQNLNAEPLIRSLIDRAILQRVAQHVAGDDRS